MLVETEATALTLVWMSGVRGGNSVWFLNLAL